jgi:hypothetical protein
MGDDFYINDLVLPESLVRSLECGSWQTPKDRDVWRSLFPESQIVQPTLYSLRAMRAETAWLSEAGPAYHGHADKGFVPGNIDPSRTVVIGDLGPDRLIALDYRESDVYPTVVALTAEEHSCWRLVATDIETLMRALHLS